MEWWQNYFDEIYLKLYSPKVDNPKRIKREVDFIEKALNLKEDMKILDLACGQGRHAIELAKRGYNVVGLDYSDYLLNVAKERTREEKVKVKFVKGDMRNLPFENEFDAIYNMFTSFGYFSDEDNFKVLKSVHRALKPGGKFLLDIVNIFWLVKNFQHEMWLKTENLICLEQNEFNPVNMRCTNKRIVFEKGKEIDQKEHTVRCYTAGEISFLMKLAGLEVEKIYGDYDLNEYSLDKRRLIIIAKAIKGNKRQNLEYVGENEKV